MDNILVIRDCKNWKSFFGDLVSLFSMIVNIFYNFW